MIFCLGSHLKTLQNKSGNDCSHSPFRLSSVDISLECYTSDLHNVTCQWDENIYKDVTHKLFYRHSPRYNQTLCTNLNTAVLYTDDYCTSQIR